MKRRDKMTKTNENVKHENDVKQLKSIVRDLYFAIENNQKKCILKLHVDSMIEKLSSM